MGTAFTLPTASDEETFQALTEADEHGHIVTVETATSITMLTAAKAWDLWDSLDSSETFTVCAFTTVEELEARAQRKASEGDRHRDRETAPALDSH